MSESLPLPLPQILVETERGMVSMRLPSAESVDQVTRHVAVSPVAVHVSFSSCGAQAQLPCGMWKLPGPGIEPLFPA